MKLLHCKLFVRVFLALALLVSGWMNSALYAQGSGKGIMTFLNAVPLETHTLFLVNGVSLKSEGFESGFCTSALLFDASSQSIVASNGDLQSDAVVVTPSSTSSPLIIATMVLKEDQQTKEMKPKLILFSAPNLAKGKGRNYQVFYSSLNDSKEFKINSDTIALKGGQGKSFLGLNGPLTIHVAGKLVATYSPETQGNFFVILYDKPDGSVGSNIAEDSVYFVGPK